MSKSSRINSEREITGSKDFWKLNPHLAVGSVASPVPERSAPSKLDHGEQKREGGKDRVPHGTSGTPKRARGHEPSDPVARITLIAKRRNPIDRSNNVASMKPLEDAIAAELGIDDDDYRISWEHGQVLTRGEEGVVVVIEYRD